ncbi:adenine-specific DNA-methyltransferase [Mariprofundus micogutta]|uniref:site-specific DNA-methyltransferase (adenine-specific) n=1 Tax=Mariprofundus micogutta TaxID=1921010 RepID=A0A1L8CQB9_9PROT|nr:N-6 DNA methylase [Mariprofundus micogutta]GAV21074.1 adenine-specific DNA-methyltransferase [Mariprofundus micogutta]
MEQNEIVDNAYRNGIEATRKLQAAEQKEMGQYMTPPSVARFMSQRCIPHAHKSSLCVLDPAAGSGVLAAAAIEGLMDCDTKPKNIKLILCELDGRMIPTLKKLANNLRNRAKLKGVSLTVSIKHGDFLLSQMALSSKAIADVIIANPPYFKINASDERAEKHSYAVYGQPNIYGLFMAACAKLLKRNGKWCFITPRSWTNGAYFAAMRKHLFNNLHIEAMHTFESRTEHFTDDEILQEAMITWATTKAKSNQNVIVSSSAGLADLHNSQLNNMPLNQVIDDDDDQMLILPTHVNGIDLKAWGSTLENYSLKVSTGPIVAFRADKFVRLRKSKQTVPFLWMQHIKHMAVQWPIKKKREHIVANAASAWMLVPNENMVVMRRFSPKEDERRVVAAPYIEGSLPGAVIGLENHTNYIYRPGGNVTEAEAVGLAAYLNSRVVNQYLRAVAGNTQINATDLRRLPLPSLDIIRYIGQSALGLSLDEIDAVVENALANENRERLAA